ncbi:39S ribosomal protein L3, mitochondrial [Zootermopsis nevadensis]|uniref:Large ribosomal subunit protein uL3m n=1 Tax=Zootermopsis nevadensis TaxID=136037 RepID=A0A067QN15_ZOONE|nr:39S ribosomal protein L3, mitochondrial [Zootermopsis nevadensis]KDR10699.1 39S ribosomal protein L3, mitochondrial [Zootermopsis nevadensis]
MAGCFKMAGMRWSVVRSFQTFCISPNISESLCCLFQQVRLKHQNYPRLRNPIWFVKKERTKYEEHLTQQNKSFIRDVVHDKYGGPPAIIGGVSTYQQSPLKIQPMDRGSWFLGCRRSGLIARNIGIYPMWLKDGTRVLTTLLQVVDNHVIRYIPPEEFNPPRTSVRNPKSKRRLGCLLVGAESADPQNFTKEYCGLFKDSGVMPTKILGRFLISPEAVMQPGTPLYASHFKVGDYVDVRGKTIYRGFQGVVTRWGFKGGPASHGVTKTHRRPGNIGSGGEKARVWPGQKMPGHMGNRYRILNGLQVLRVNTKYNVIWVKGQGIPGGTNSIVYIYDTFLPLRKPKEAPHFPTYYPEDEEPLPDEIYSENLHPFTAPTIKYEENV